MSLHNGIGDDPRIDQILEVVMELAGGNLQARAEQSDRGDSMDALIMGINMLAEEIDRKFEENRGLTAALIREKERTIAAQQTAILELSTPVIQIWDEILVLPLIGTLDTMRANRMIEELLERIAATQASVAIIDITGTPVIDSQVAQHLIRTIQASNLLGATCMLTGVSPAIAQSMSQMGISLGEIVTRGSLQKGLEYAFKLTGKKL